MLSQNTQLDVLPIREPTFFILLSLVHGKKHGYAILKDIEAFGDALIELVFNKDLRQEMGRKGREKVLENYILEKQAHKYQSLFKEVLSEKISDKEKVQELRKPSHTMFFLNETYDQRIFPLFKKFVSVAIHPKPTFCIVAKFANCCSGIKSISFPGM